MKFYLTTLLACGVCLSLFSQTIPAVYQELEANYEQEAFDACLQMEKQVERFAQGRIDTLAANCYFYLGDAHYQAGNFQKSISFFEREKSVLSTLGTSYAPDLSTSLNNLAWLYLQTGNYAQGEKTADELLENDRKLYAADKDLYVGSVLAIADIYLEVDRFTDAAKLLQQTLRAQQKESLNRAILLNKLGELYSYTGEYRRASDYLLRALSIASEKAGEDSKEYTNAAINLGILYMYQGKYPEAEEIFEVALSQLDATEPAYASLLNNQALVLQGLGQFDRAEKALLDIRKRDSLEVGDAHPNFAITLSNLGLLYADQGKFSQAEHTLRQALLIQKESDGANHLSYARKLNNLAKVLQMAGAPEKAVPLLEEALDIFRKTMGKSSPEFATAAHNLGVAQWKSGNGEAGYKNMKVGLAIRARLLGKNHPRYAESQLKIAEYLWYKKDFRGAHQSFNEVFENYYFQIDEMFPVLTEEEKARFYYTHIRSAFDKYNSFALAHRSVEPAFVGDVYNHLINTKAAIMFATEKVRASIYESGDSLLIGKYEMWQTAREQIARLYSLNQEHASLDSLVNATDFLEKELARQSVIFQNQFVKERHHWNSIHQTLKPDEAAVEVLRFRNYLPDGGGSFSEEVRYGFLVITPSSRHQPSLVLLNNGNDMESKYLKYYRNNIRYKLDDTQSYINYFEPLARLLAEQKIRRVWFSADGVYNQINLNSLQNPETGKFLLEEFDIRLVTNTRELAEPKLSATTPGRSVLMGYPQFNLDTLLNEGDDIKPLRGAGLSRTWRGGLLRYMRGEEGISLLPGTQEEVARISQLLQGNSFSYTGAGASESVAKHVDNPRILHIATHGYFLEDAIIEGGKSYVSSPLLNAGLILSGAENFLKTGLPVNQDGDDGILTAFEAMNLRLDKTDLVVLSACETALGDVVNGEGVYGLQRAFRLAGARNMIMSLWNVDDEATQELMTTFYKEMLKTGDQHAAFRTAQKRVKEKYPSPFYWGAFVMMGI